ncbi:DUF4232 domain-containing protein [Streptomyces sp. NPDC054813]
MTTNGFAHEGHDRPPRPACSRPCPDRNGACGPGTDGASSGGSSAAAGADASSGTSSTGGRAAADGSSSSTSNGRSAGQDQGSGSDGGPGACAASNLKVAAENPDSGAGTTHFQLVFQNTGAIPCTHSGFPGVSFRGRDGAQIGNAATRDSGTSVTTVTLLPNGHATADVSAPDGRSGFSADECKLTDVSLRPLPAICSRAEQARARRPAGAGQRVPVTRIVAASEGTS